MTSPLPRLATHSGKFHCDDAFAYATLRLAIGLHEAGRDHVLLRTRDRALIDAADIVWDVGTRYDPAAQRFDHHQRGAPVRAENDLPFSSAGLIWQAHGVQAVRAILPAASAALAEPIAAAIDRDVIRRIDAIDNGVAHPEDSLGLSSVVDDCNLPWDSPEAGNPDAETRAFIAAADLMAGFLRNRVERVRGKLAADAVIVAAHKASEDPRILELDRRMPWQSAAFRHELPVLYAVYPVPAGNWMVDAMPAEKGSFSQRLPLPAAWAGLEADALAAVSGIADAVFVHTARFVGAARSREGAMRMAAAAIALSEPPVLQAAPAL